VMQYKLTEVAPLIAERVPSFEGEKLYVATGSLDDRENISGEYVTYKDRPSRADLIVKRNDLCFARMQDTKKICLITEKKEKFIYSTGFAVIRPNLDIIFPRFLYHLLNSIPFQIKKNSLCSGATQKAITNEKINSIEIEVPDISEQIRIAKILDSAEVIYRNRELAIKKLGELAKSVFIEMFGDRKSNNLKLDKLPLSKIASISSGSTPSRSESDLMGGDILWIKTTELVGKKIYDSQEKLSKKGLQSIGGKINPENSILVAMYGQGQTRGRVGLLSAAAATNQACGVIRPNETFSSNFMFWQLKFAYEDLRALGRGGNQENLNLQLLGGFEVLMPPLSQQLAYDNFIAKYEAANASFDSYLHLTSKLIKMVQLESYGN